jgi:hypothetical protein
LDATPVLADIPNRSALVTIPAREAKTSDNGSALGIYLETMMIAGLEELVLRCPDESGRIHIREAIKSYEGSAYRAAIITTYVAVCFDLIEKLRALAAAGDAEAKALLVSLSNLQNQQANNDPKAVSGLLEFERSLLEVFRNKFDFFGTHEFEDLNRLRQDRNRCAHPSFLHTAQPYSPTAELARLHISNAINLVLSQQPRQGKAALESLKAVVLSQNFPTSRADALERLKGSELANGRDALVRAFVDELAFGWPDSASPYHKKLAAVHALLATVEINRPIAVPRAAVAMEKLLMSPEPDAVHFGGVIALRVPDAGEIASEPARAVIKQWLQNPKTRGRANAVRHALVISWLLEVARGAASTLTASEIANATGEVPEEVISRAVELFASVNNWAEANDLAPKIMVPFAGKFTVVNIERVLIAAKSGAADLQGSGGFRQFLDAVAEQNPIGKEGLNALLATYDLDHYTIGAEADPPEVAEE